MATFIPNPVSLHKTEERNPFLEYIFIQELKNIYWTETLHLRLLPNMSSVTKSLLLKRKIRKHSLCLKKQIRELEEIFGYLGHKPKFQFYQELCLFPEGKNLIYYANYHNKDMDSAFIRFLLKVCHLEQNIYTRLIELAEILGYNNLSNILYTQIVKILTYRHNLTTLYLKF
jgi:ferritin-like metal-binding protein YciE